MTEIFVPIKGYEGLYEVSNLGKIKSLPKMRGTNYSCPISEKIMSPKDNGNGYLQVALSKNSNKTRYYVHILKNMIGDNHPLSKRVVQLDMDGNFIKEWSNGNEVMQMLGYGNSHISRCCKGKTKSAYGYRWEYKKSVA
jgi:hypothetical protein